MKYFLVLYSLLFTAHLDAQCPEAMADVILNGQIGLDIFVNNNPTCTYISSLELRGNITDVSGLSTLKSMGYFYINDCPLLTDITAFSNIDSIHGNLGIENETGFFDLKGFTNLVYIGQDLRITETTNLESLNGLDNLNTVVDDLEVEYNQALTCLKGLGSMQLTETVSITDNPLLTDCCGVQDLLTSGSPAFVWVENNPMECSNVDEIINKDCSTTCLLSTKSTQISNSILYPNPAESKIHFSFDNGHTSFVTICNTLGYETEFGEVLSDEDIDISRLSAGMYVVKLQHSNGGPSELFKLIIQ